jgi:RHS repeat-associated protein
MRIQYGFLCLVLFFVAFSAFGQVATGVPPLGSFSLTDPDVINLGDLNVHFPIGVLSKPGRGTSFDYVLSYDSSIWAPVFVGGVKTWVSVDNWGWRNVSEVATGFISFDDNLETCDLPSPPVVTKPLFTNFKYHDKFGVVHSFDNIAGGCPGDGIDNVSISSDVSGYSLDTTTAGQYKVTLPTGQTIHPPNGSSAGAGTFTDRNGNQITTNGSTFTDTLGMTALSVTGGAPSPLVLKYTTSSGLLASVSINYTSKIVQTKFLCSGVAEYGPLSINLVSSISLPDGSSYSFDYETTPGGVSGAVTGRISKITLRTGGTINYTYTGGSNGIECVDGSTAGLTRTMNDGTSNVGTTTYSRSGSGINWSTTILDGTVPTANQTVVNFQTAGSPINFYETHRVVNQGTSTSLLTTDTCYNTATPDCTGTAITPPILRVKHYSTVGTALTSLTDTSFNSSGLPTEVDEYDFGASPHGSSLKKTITTYSTIGVGLAPHTITVQDGGGIQQALTTYDYDGTTTTGTSGVPQHIAVGISRGNLTKLTQWVAGATNVISTFTYDDTGNMLTSTDPALNVTQYSYTDNFSDSISRGTLAYLTQTTFPSTGLPSISHITTAKYEPNTGLPTVTSDLNGNQTTYAYDSMLRPLQINFPDGGQSSNTYASPTSTIQSRQIATSQTFTTTIVVDAFGRLAHQQLTSDPVSITTTDTTYDGNGRVASVSNPHRTATNSTDGTTQMAYDALGRLTLLTHPDSDTVQASYSNNCATTTDETGRTRKTCFDALGRTTATYEPNDTDGTLTWETDTTYDVFDNIKQITQQGGDVATKWRTRSFSYDGLSRLTQSITPESGTTNLYYNISGSPCAGDTSVLCQRTDARAITTTYAYDALSRLTGKTYTDTTPSVTYSYDQTTFNGLIISNGNGARTGMTDISGLTAWSFDSMGRVAKRQQKIGTVTKSIGYTYNLDGSVATMTYPSGRVYTYGYNNAGETTSLADTAKSINFFSSALYAPPGLLTSGVHGAVTGWNAITLANAYNSRLQPTQLQATSPLPSVLLNLSYSYTQLGHNNGSVVEVTNGRDSTRTTAYTYDNINRLSTAQTPTAATWGNSYLYDAWGNLLQKNVIKGTAEAMSIMVDTNNHISSTGFTYDAAGNLTYDTSVHMAYDAENRMNPTGGTTYTYDGDDRRVAKSDGTVYWVDDNLRPVSVGTSSGSLTKDFVFIGSQRIAFVSLSSGNPYYYLSDSIGSTAVVGSGDGKSIEWEADYFPFGSLRQVYASSVNNNYEFTGYEYDSDTGYNYANARFDAGRWGRFLSPDPYSGSMNITNPRSLNRYSYVSNDPTNLVDPSGLYTAPWGGIGGIIGTIIGEDLNSAFRLLGLDGSPIPGEHIVAGGGGGGSSNKATPKKPPQAHPPNPAQCEAIRTLLEREAKDGTTLAAWQSAIGVGDRTLQPFNSSDPGKAYVQTAAGPVKLDWFTDIRLTTLIPGPQILAYVAGKFVWTGIRVATNAPITNPFPFQDPVEVHTAVLATAGYGFRNLFTPDFMRQNCGTY